MASPAYKVYIVLTKCRVDLFGFVGLGREDPRSLLSLGHVYLSLTLPCKTERNLSFAATECRKKIEYNMHEPSLNMVTAQSDDRKTEVLMHVL